MTARLTIEPAPDAGPGARRFIVTCPHGIGTGTHIPSHEPPSDPVFAALTIARHALASGCDCARSLLPPGPAELWVRLA